MRSFAAAALAFSLFAAPAFAKKAASTKGPQAGRFCSKTQVGQTAQDAKGATLECKAGKGGRAHWVKR